MNKIFRFFIAAVIALNVFVSVPVFYSSASIVYESYLTVNGTQTHNGAYGNYAYGQTFTPSTQHILGSVSLLMYREGIPPSDLHVAIRNTSGNIPSGGDLISANISYDNFGTDTDGTWVQINFDTQLLVSAGTKYAIVIYQCDGTGDGSHSYEWIWDMSGQYSGGTKCQGYISGSWGYVANGDFLFAEYGAGQPSPIVITQENVNKTTLGAVLYGAVFSDLTVTEYGFNLGTESDNYTYNDYYSGDISGSYQLLVPYTELTNGQTYYFQAYAVVNGETYNGSEHSFIWNIQNVSVTTNEATVVQTVSGNFTAAFSVTINPVDFDGTVSAFMSQNINFTSGEDLYFTGVSEDGQTYTYDTWNGTSGVTGVLLPDTTYYYEGIVTSGNTTYYGNIRSFTTANASIPDKPTVKIKQISSVSDDYNANYTFKVTGQLGTTNTTDLVINQGVEFSLTKSPSGILLPSVYSYYAEVYPDGSFSKTFSLADASWYSGQKLYFIAYCNTAYYGKITSSIVEFTPKLISGTDDNGVSDADAGGNDISDFSNIVKNLRVKLGLNGPMGIWAFLALILLILALFFGTAMFTTMGVTRSVIGVVWALLSIAVIGAFVFTGELGAMPILIMVGAVVVLIMIFASVKLSGSGGNING